MEGGVSHSGLAVVKSLPRVTGEPLTRIANGKLDWFSERARMCELG